MPTMKPIQFAMHLAWWKEEGTSTTSCGHKVSLIIYFSFLGWIPVRESHIAFHFIFQHYFGPPLPHHIRSHCCFPVTNIITFWNFPISSFVRRWYVSFFFRPRPVLSTVPTITTARAQYQNLYLVLNYTLGSVPVRQSRVFAE